MTNVFHIAAAVVNKFIAVSTTPNCTGRTGSPVPTTLLSARSKYDTSLPRSITCLLTCWFHWLTRSSAEGSIFFCRRLGLQRRPGTPARFVWHAKVPRNFGDVGLPPGFLLRPRVSHGTVSNCLAQGEGKAT